MKYSLNNVYMVCFPRIELDILYSKVDLQVTEPGINTP